MCLVVLGITSFLVRGIVLDIVIPTQHVMSKAVNVKKEIYDSLTAGGLLIFKKELSRWGEYLLKSNIGLFLAVLLGLFFLVSPAFKPRKANLRWGNMSIALGCLTALGTLTFVDPHPWASHGLAIVPFFMVILARELESVKDLKARSVGISFLLVLVIFCAAVKVGQGANQIRKGIQYKYSNPAVITTLNNVLVEKKNYVIIGPTEVWPYINPKANVVINDNARAKGMEALRGIINEFDFIVLDSDYEGYNWEARFKERYPLIRLEKIAEVGTLENGSYHLKILKPIRQ